MCGIAGVIRIHEPGDGPPPAHLEAIPEAWLDVLDESIKHRGPDGQGRFRDRAVREDGTVVDVALVHRRLSIIDHEGGHQPMVHDGERLRADLTYQSGEMPIVASEVAPGLPIVAVVFNGCIYNHRELRAELEDAGHVFATDHSDTEALVHGWREWDVTLQDKIDGMLSFRVWDRQFGQVGFGRDMCGEKPQSFRYGTSSSLMRMFASTTSGLVLLDPPAPFCDSSNPIRDFESMLRVPGWASSYLTNCFAMEPRRWGVEPAAPHRNACHSDKRLSHTVLMRSSASRIQRIPKRGARPQLSSVGRTDRIIQATIRSRLEADVPLGVFLSGGIDSALIAAITHEHRSDVKAFTVRMPDARFDESVAAAETAEYIGIEHYVLECDPHPADDLVMLIEQMGLPFGDSSLLPTYWVSKAAREHVKVALSGDGGDELFGGYRRHTIAPVLNKWRWFLGLIPDSLLDRRVAGSRSSYLARLATAARHGGYEELLAIFPTPDLRRLVPDIEGVHTGYGRYRRVEDPLRYDFTHYLPDDLLRKTDTASMAVGLEVRAPFLAKELVEAAMRTPLDVLMPNGERKGLLKRVARRYLPDSIVDRPKQGFAIPVGEWFRSDYGGMRQLLHDHMNSSDPFPGLEEAGVEIDMDFVRRMMREHDAAGEKSINPWHGRDHSQRLYMVLVLSIWARWLDRVRRGEG